MRFEAIDALIAEWAPGGFVVGRPLHGDGSEHAMTARAERFARQLEARFGLPVARVDERFTTRAAAERWARPACADARASGADEVAAQPILQACFDEPGSGILPPS